MSWIQTSSKFPAGGSFKIDGVHSDTFGAYYRSWAYDILPTTRSGMIDIPGRRGKIDNGSENSSRLITLDISIYDPDPAKRWAFMHAWAAALNPETGPHTLELVDENPGWILYVQAVGGTASPIEPLEQFTQSFEAADPHWYTLTDPSLGVPFGGSPSYGTIVNYGNTFSDVQMNITATPGLSLTNPVIRIDNTNFSLFGTLGPGETWAVLGASKQVLRNGISDPTHWSGDFPVVPGTQAGFAAGGLGSLLVWTDAFNQGGFVTFYYRTRLL